MIKEILKTRVKFHGDGVTSFCNKEIPRVDSNHTCLAVISLDYALKKDENYQPQVFVKECKYIKKKLIRHVIDDLESSFDSQDDSDDFDEEQIKAKRLMYFENYLFGKVTLKNIFLMEQF